jgi:hypothetical protein
MHFRPSSTRHCGPRRLWFGPFLTRRCTLGRSQCSRRQLWRGSLGRLSTLGRSKYHFSQRRRFRRRREQTLVSSWAPAQWLRRDRRAPVTMVPSPMPKFGCCLRPPVTQPLCRGLTLPSNGHTTAGHNVSLRQGWSRRCVPLMSNVRPHRSAAAMPRKSLPQRSAWAVRPAAASEPAVACKETASYRQPGLSVLRRPANHRCLTRGNASSPFVPTSARSSQVGRVRVSSQAHDRRAHHHLHHGQ